MPSNREVDFMPGGDFSFAVVVPQARQRCTLALYTWDQVERDMADGRYYQPSHKIVMAHREMLQLAKHLLTQAGHPMASRINIPDQDWNKAGGESNGS